MFVELRDVFWRLKSEFPIKAEEVINSTRVLDVVRRPWIRILEGS